MDVLILLDKLDDLIYSSKPIPLTEQVRVEREEAYSLLDQIRVSLPEEIKQARWIVKERQEQARSPKKAEVQAEPEPEAGSPHLQEIVDSIEELKRSQRPAPPPLTAAAAEKVRSVIEAAEASAAEIREEADREARRIEGDAARRGMEMRKRSAAEASARLKRADEVTAALLAEAGSASADIDNLLDRVRGPAALLADALGDGANKVQADFARMRARVAEAPVGEDWSAAADPKGEIVARRDDAPSEEEAEVPDEPEAEVDRARVSSQATEEWSYEDAMSGHDDLDDEDQEEIQPPLSGPHSNVAADRLNENGAAAGAKGSPQASSDATPSRRFERPHGQQHARP